MPVLGSSAFTTVEVILDAARAILDDLDIVQGDVLTDDYPGAVSLVNIAYRNVQKELATVGVETFIDYAWLLAIPPMPASDPEARIVVSDSGTQITYPDITIYNPPPSPLNFDSPQLPVDMIVPLKLWERQNGTTCVPRIMGQPNDGLQSAFQQTYLCEWEWGSYQSTDGLIFRGALQTQDVKVKYEKSLANVADVTDPVPIRGVDNAAAYQVAKVFAAGRGEQVAAGFGAEGQNEIFLLQSIAVRRSQRKRGRRMPYSGRGGGSGWPIL